MTGNARLDGQWDKTRGTLRRAARTGRARLRRELLREAAKLAGTIKENIVKGGELVGSPFKPNAELTIKLKKSSKPLIHDGDLMNSIAAHKINPDTVLVGIPGDARPKKGNTDDYIARYARANEYGVLRTTSTGKKVWMPPARPFIRPVLDHTRHKRRKEWQGSLQELFR
ncbi:MAG: hypothetical protein AAF471_05035 [Myxococcota bacterium]